MRRTSVFCRDLLLLAFAALFFAFPSHADDKCERIVAQLFAQQSNTAEWGRSSSRLEPAETARLHAAHAVNAISMTVKRLRANNTDIYRIVASSDQPAVHAYSYDGAVDYISRFANEAGTDRPLMIYLQGFPDDQSLSLRQTLRVHLNNDRSFFLETGPAVRPADLPSLVKRHPILTDAKVSGVILKPDEMLVSITTPVRESSSPVSIRVTIKVKGVFDTLSDILARLVKRFTAALLGLPPNADLQLTALTVRKELERELALIEKETGIGRKDLTVQLAVEAGDIYFSLPGNLPLPPQDLALNSCSGVCSAR